MNESIILKVRIAISLLASRSLQTMRLFMRSNGWSSKFRWSKTISTFGIITILFSLVGNVQAFQGYNVVITTIPAVEASFLASTTAQFQNILNPNPLASNVYSINLLGFNPNYVSPGQVVPSAPCQLDQDISNMVANSTWTYVYGFGDGMSYQQKSETGVVGYLQNLCSTATYFNLVQATTSTFNKATCSDVIGTIENQLFNLSSSTPIVIPPEP